MASIPVNQGLPLASLPGAPATLYLDFDGHFQDEVIGEVLGIGGWEKILTPPWSRDADPLTFSDAEQAEIRLIWQLVADDFSPFNINVTTQDPDPTNTNLDAPYLRVVISGDDDFSGNGFEGLTAQDPTGGFSAYADPDQPNVSYVFGIDSSGKRQTTRALGESISHEASHSFGNDHNYFGVADASKAPIMGEGGPLQPGSNQFATRGVWSDKGGFFTGNFGRKLPRNLDEMRIIASDENGFGYRPDDHGNFFSNATPLAARSGVAGIGLQGQGVIEWMTDIDYFTFTTGGASSVSIVVTPPGVGNLDATLRLYNSAGELLAESNDPSFLTASVKTPLVAGTYYVQVGGFGAYGDVGQYMLAINEQQGPQIVQAEIQGVTSTMARVRVTFDEPIDPSSFTKADVRISFGGSIVSVQPSIGGNFKTWSITVKKPTTTAQWSVFIGPNINDWFGNAMDQNANGVKGESADTLRLNFLGDSFGTNDSGWSDVGGKKTIRLAPRFVDAVFQRA